MTDISELDTPAVLIDLDRVEANLLRVQAYADSHGLRLRPHFKTHKLPRWLWPRRSPIRRASPLAG